MPPTSEWLTRLRPNVALLRAAQPSCFSSSSAILPISHHPQRSTALWPCALQSNPNPSQAQKSSYEGKAWLSQQPRQGLGWLAAAVRMLSSRNASLAAMCIHSWETNAQGNAFLCSHVTPRVTSTFWKTFFLLPSQNRALQHISLAHYKWKSKLALLDLLHLGCSVHQLAEQGCLVLQCEWFMVSHVLMCYIIHLVLVPMNISSWDRSTYQGANWCLAVF